MRTRAAGGCVALRPPRSQRARRRCVDHSAPPAGVGGDRGRFVANTATGRRIQPAPCVRPAPHRGVGRTTRSGVGCANKRRGHCMRHTRHTPETWLLMEGFKARLAGEPSPPRAPKEWRRGWLVAQRMTERAKALQPKRRRPLADDLATDTDSQFGAPHRTAARPTQPRPAARDHRPTKGGHHGQA